MSLNYSGNPCPSPFYDESEFPSSGGYIAGRYCGASPIQTNISCCLPCPVQQWVFPENYINTQLNIPNYLSTLSLALCGFLTISFLVLPPEQTHRHYLSVGLLFPSVFIALAFVIPLGAETELCYNTITPNDMHSDSTCAWTGVLLSLGGMGSVVWVLLRALWLHIRVCWDRDPGRPFFIGSLVVGMALPAGLLAAVLAATGVSYRTGKTCLPNHEHAIASFWIWLVGFASLSFLLQMATTGWCIWIYFRTRKRQRAAASSAGSAPLRSYPASTAAASSDSPQQAWRKVRKLFLLQWRNIVVSLLVTIESIYFVVVFWAQDAKLGNVSSKASDLSAARTWSICLVLSGGDKDQCMHYAKGLMVPRSTVLTSLILASLVGIEIFFLLARWSMFEAWWTLICSPVRWFRNRGNKRHSGEFLTSMNETDGLAHHTVFLPIKSVNVSEKQRASPPVTTVEDEDSSSSPSSATFPASGRSRDIEEPESLRRRSSAGTGAAAAAAASSTNFSRPQRPSSQQAHHPHSLAPAFPRPDSPSFLQAPSAPVSAAYGEKYIPYRPPPPAPGAATRGASPDLRSVSPFTNATAAAVAMPRPSMSPSPDPLHRHHYHRAGSSLGISPRSSPAPSSSGLQRPLSPMSARSTTPTPAVDAPISRRRSPVPPTLQPHSVNPAASLTELGHDDKNRPPSPLLAATAAAAAAAASASAAAVTPELAQRESGVGVGVDLDVRRLGRGGLRMHPVEPNE